MKAKQKWRQPVESWSEVADSNWMDWKWQMRASLKTLPDFEKHFELTFKEREGFQQSGDLFRIQTTPYYAQLAYQGGVDNPIRKMVFPSSKENVPGLQQMLDPLGENKKENRATARLIHRYTDRALFLATDICGVYCRYCTRKHFTASDQVMANSQQVDEAVAYLKEHPEIKELILSGGDPLTLGNSKIDQLLSAFYSVESLELIRIGSRMPVVNPFRIDQELLQIFRKYPPIYFMTHFNHPDELREENAQALERLVDHGVPVFNQLVLLNGINNHPALIYSLSRRLLQLRVKPYYMFQVDPSLGTDHLRTSIEDSLEIQKQLWGHSSGLVMPNFVVDIPDGGGKAPFVPNFLLKQSDGVWEFQGWDGVKAQYHSPAIEQVTTPPISEEYMRDWLSP